MILNWWSSRGAIKRRRMLSGLQEGGSPSFPGKAQLSAWLCRICCDAMPVCLCLQNGFFLLLFLSKPWLVFAPSPRRVEVRHTFDRLSTTTRTPPSTTLGAGVLVEARLGKCCSNPRAVAASVRAWHLLGLGFYKPLLACTASVFYNDSPRLAYQSKL